MPTELPLPEEGLPGEAPPTPGREPLVSPAEKWAEGDVVEEGALPETEPELIPTGPEALEEEVGFAEAGLEPGPAAGGWGSEAFEEAVGLPEVGVAPVHFPPAAERAETEVPLSTEVAFPAGIEAEPPLEQLAPSGRATPEPALAAAGPQLLSGIVQSISPATIFSSPHRPTGMGGPASPWGEVQAATFQSVITPQRVAKPEVAPTRPAELASSILRWLLYLLIAVSIAVPLLVGGRFPPRLSIAPATQEFFNALENVTSEQVVLVAHDYDLSTFAEMEPLAAAAVQHLAERGARLLNVSLTLQGPAVAEQMLEASLEGYRDYRYGVDYLELGYLAGEDVAARQVGEAFLDPDRLDYREGKALQEFSVLSGVRRWEDIGLVLVLAADPAALRRWVEQVEGPYGRILVAGVSAQVDPLARPYLRSGQLRGLLSGVVGTAEYEQLREHPGEASLILGPLSLAHVAIVLLVLLANLEVLLARLIRRS
jgi:hypothetical protein